MRGHVIAVKPGHGPNAELARALAQGTRQDAAGRPAARFSAAEKAASTSTQVMEILPHRYPFLMVDRIIGFEGETKITGVKSVTVNEPYFAGHFPGHPVMPGVLQVEAMAQVASILMMKITKSASRIGYFMSADEVKFRKPVFPGDTLFIRCRAHKGAKQSPRESEVSVPGERRRRFGRRADVHVSLMKRMRAGKVTCSDGALSPSRTSGHALPRNGRDVFATQRARANGSDLRFTRQRSSTAGRDRPGIHRTVLRSRRT